MNWYCQQLLWLFCRRAFAWHYYSSPQAIQIWVSVRNVWRGQSSISGPLAFQCTSLTTSELRKASLRFFLDSCSAHHQFQLFRNIYDELIHRCLLACAILQKVISGFTHIFIICILGRSMLGTYSGWGLWWFWLTCYQLSIIEFNAYFLQGGEVLFYLPIPVALIKFSLWLFSALMCITKVFPSEFTLRPLAQEAHHAFKFGFFVSFVDGQ